MVSQIITITTKVETPNGVGYVQGRIWSNGAEYLLVRHLTEDIKQKVAGHQLTSMEHPSCLWQYERSEVTPV
ncbi:MAG: hypothetical protein DDT31_01494 [Syntrophomonadaceae bacterium]|nr:hypothetical protein [Bacillota bacterium]